MSAEKPTPKVRGWRRWAPAITIGVAVVWLLFDQWSKNWALATLPKHEVVPVLGDVLQWYLVRNPGAAFSFATGSTWIFTILAAVVVGVIIWQLRRLGSLPWSVFLGLLLGGVLGNLTDRLFRDPGFAVGHVVDFILTPWMWLGFPPAIYNVADIGIVGGMALFIVIVLLGLPIDGSPRERARDRKQARTRDESDAAEPSLATDAGGDDEEAGERGAS